MSTTDATTMTDKSITHDNTIKNLMNDVQIAIEHHSSNS